MIDVRKTAHFEAWFGGLRDLQAKARILVRIDRLALGNAGDVKAVGAGVSEMRLTYGPGYRVYFARQGETVVILLAGGDKSTQEKDIAKALELARTLPAPEPPKGAKPKTSK